MLAKAWARLSPETASRAEFIAYKHLVEARIARAERNFPEARSAYSKAALGIGEPDSGSTFEYIRGVRAEIEQFESQRTLEQKSRESTNLEKTRKVPGPNGDLFDCPRSGACRNRTTQGVQYRISKVMNPRTSICPYLRRLGRAALVLASTLTLNASLQAQELLGRWEDVPNDLSLELFVSPTGSDLTGTATPSNPVRSITAALNLTQVLFLDPVIFNNPVQQPNPIRITINVAPGSYSASTGEVFPLRMPAHGLSLETWAGGSASLLDRPRIDAGQSVAIQVDWIGAESMPATVIQTLEIQNASIGILIDPSLVSPQFTAVPVVPLAVEIRQNYIHDCQQGIELTTVEDSRSTYVIEDNDIGDNSLISGIAILEENQGTASTLYRSNRIQCYEEGIRVTGVSAEDTVPRLFSNFIQIGENLVTIRNCNSFVINNTVAFAMDFTFVSSVSGISLQGGSCRLANNIIWCPVTTFGTPATDLTNSGAILTSITNLIEDSPGGLTPGFIISDLHPGQAAANLHLGSNSMMIAAGTNSEVAAPVVTTRSTQAGTMVVRTDVSVDNDLDGRVFLSAVEAGPTARVDIGGDEFVALQSDGDRECRITLPASSNQDRFGNLIALPISPATPTLRTWQANLQLSGPPNASWTLIQGYGYFDQITDPALQVPTQNGSIYQNLLAGSAFGIPSLGNVSVDLSGAHYILISGTFNDTGTTTLANFDMAKNINVSFQETELNLQMITNDPATGRIAASNRIKVEFNDRP